MFISDQKYFQERDAGGRYAWRACSRGRLTSCLKIRAVGTWVCVSVAASKGLLSSGDRGLHLGKTESLTTGPLCIQGFSPLVLNNQQRTRSRIVPAGPLTALVDTQLYMGGCRSWLYPQPSGQPWVPAQQTATLGFIFFFEFPFPGEFSTQ